MIASALLRPAARGRRSQARRANISWESRVRPARRRVTAAASRRHVRLPRAGAGVRLFVLSAGMLATAFLLALLYLRFATSIAAGGYDLHALQARRDELVRTNQLLELDLRRLDSPARIEAEAQRLGLRKVARTTVVAIAPSVAGAAGSIR